MISTPITRRIVEIHEKHDHPFKSQPIYRAYERLADGELFPLYMSDDDPAMLEKAIRSSSAVQVEFVETF